MAAATGAQTISTQAACPAAVSLWSKTTQTTPPLTIRAPIERLALSALQRMVGYYYEIMQDEEEEKGLVDGSWAFQLQRCFVLSSVFFIAWLETLPKMDRSMTLVQNGNQ